MAGNGRGGERGRERLIHTGLGGGVARRKAQGAPGKQEVAGRARACRGHTPSCLLARG